MRADTVVYVAHDSMTLFDDGLLPLHLLHAPIVLLQFGTLLRDARFELGVESSRFVESHHERVGLLRSAQPENQHEQTAANTDHDDQVQAGGRHEKPPFIQGAHLGLGSDRDGRGGSACTFVDPEA